MAYSTTLTSVSAKLKEGMSEWVKSGYTFLGQVRAMLLAHTHTGTTDGTALVAASLGSGAVTAGKIDTGGVSAATQVASGILTTTQFTAAAKTHLHESIFIKGTDTPGALAGYPVFQAPVACVVSGAYLIPGVNVVGTAADKNTLTLYRYTAGVVAGTLAAVTTAASGTLLAFNPLSLGTITGGTLVANDVLTLARATVGGGTPLSESHCAIVWNATGV